jgi:hypothetical protein
MKKINLSTVIGYIFAIWAVLGTINFLTSLVFGWDFCIFTVTSLSFLMNSHIWAIYVLGIGAIFSYPMALCFLPDK